MPVERVAEAVNALWPIAAIGLGFVIGTRLLALIRSGLDMGSSPNTRGIWSRIEPDEDFPAPTLPLVQPVPPAQSEPERGRCRYCGQRSSGVGACPHCGAPQ